MPAKKEIITALNAVLKHELAAINQYFLHARMLKHLGFMTLADAEYKASIDEMKHADELVERVLELGGTPNLQEIGRLHIGEELHDILKCDLARKEAAAGDIKAAMAAARQHDDQVTMALLTAIQTSEVEHARFTSEQLELIDRLDEQAYMKTQV